MKTQFLFNKSFVSIITKLVLSIVVIIQLNAQATGLICVSTNGNDANDGTAGSPLLNVQTALDMASTGDTIKVAFGTYNEELITKVSIILLGGYVGRKNRMGDAVDMLNHFWKVTGIFFRIRQSYPVFHRICILTMKEVPLMALFLVATVV